MRPVFCTAASVLALVTAFVPSKAVATSTTSAAARATVVAKVAVAAPKAPTAVPKPAVLSKEVNMLYATGEGAMPSVKEQPNRAKAYLQAKAYAKMDAIASLAQSAKGTLVSYCSDGHGYMAETKIKEEIKAFLDYVQVVSAKKRAEGSDTIVEVTVRAPKPVPPKLPAAPKSQTVPAVEKRVLPSWVNGSVPAAGAVGYTSVIIDAKGLGVARSMSPKLVRRDGSEVWGTVKVDPDFLNEHGLVGYARGKSQALDNRRTGPNPLVIRAIGRGGSATGGDVVISNSDAERILDEDRRSHFLADFRVVVIVD